MSTTPSRPTGAASPERLRSDLTYLDDLPSPPEVLQEIWEVLGAEGSSAQCLSDAVEKDTALTAKLLRLANSAYFALAQPVGEVRSACVVLGFEMVRALAVGVSSLDALTSGTGSAFDLRAFWRHSVGTGTAAQMLARRLRMPGAGTAFCAGILHDVGKLVLATLSPERYARLTAAPEGGSLRDRERAEFGGDHELCGAFVGEQWRFPPEILSAIRHHHEPWEADGVDRWGALLHVANWIARTHACPSVPDPGDPPDAPDPRAMEILALPGDTLDDVAKRFGRDLEKVEAFVDLARG